MQNGKRRLNFSLSPVTGKGWGWGEGEGDENSSELDHGTINRITKWISDPITLFPSPLTGEDKGGGESRIDPPLQHLSATDRKRGEGGFEEVGREGNVSNGPSFEIQLKTPPASNGTK